MPAVIHYTCEGLPLSDLELFHEAATSEEVENQLGSIAKTVVLTTH